MSATDKTAIELKAVTMLPTKTGHFGPYGGRFVSETLSAALDELQVLYSTLSKDPAFQKEFDEDLAHYVGRPSPLYFAERLTEKAGGAKIYLKREDLIHPTISGNKYRKLKYNFLEAKNHNHTSLLSFGGAYSNHIEALSFAGKEQECFN